MTSPNLVMVGSYDYLLVSLSVLLAILASWTALDLAGRVIAAHGGARLWWLIGGSIAMGIGIWSMHYVGMLAFSLPVPVQYDYPMVLLSLLDGILSSVLALVIVSQQPRGWPWALIASVFMGAGIETLHYTAMAAMRLPAMCRYSSPLVALSVGLAIAFSLIALWLTFFFRDEPTGIRVRKATGALLMGTAISAMHYTGMAAASFTPSTAAPDLSHAVSISSLGTAAIIIVALMVLWIALLTSLVDRLQKQRTLLDELFEQTPQAVALLSANNQVVRMNREFTRIFGYTPQETLGRRLSELIVPDEGREGEQRAADLVAHGLRVEAESIRQRKDGSRLHVSMVQVPVLVPDGQVEIYAIYRDITARKQAEETLRQLSGRLLRLQDEERRRIARELHDSTAQNLSALAMFLSQLQDLESGRESRARQFFAQSLQLTEQCLREVRTLSYLLHPPFLDEMGLASALRWYAEGFTQRSGISVTVEEAPELSRLPQDVELALFRIVQESLTNIHQHSGSPVASIRLRRDPSHVRLTVADEGRGMPPEMLERVRAGGSPLGVGIAGMHERMRQLGGRLAIYSDRQGTRVTAMLPLGQSDA